MTGKTPPDLPLSNEGGFFILNQTIMKKTTLSKLKDNADFKLSLRSTAATWTVITKRKNMITINSRGNSTRILKASTICFV